MTEDENIELQVLETQKETWNERSIDGRIKGFIGFALGGNLVYDAVNNAVNTVANGESYPYWARAFEMSTGALILGYAIYHTVKAVMASHKVEELTDRIAEIEKNSPQYQAQNAPTGTTT
ncbi:hypothetical protein HYU16_00420 [Candidatus Woesearchaeota archaeon]|nr:hypothetical protein [Candidatus Woesearchaeota archaeon]